MGAFLDKPKTEKFTERGAGNGLRFGLSSMQGWRVEMEDAHTAIIGFPGLEEWAFFAVYDGHAGSRASRHCSQQLLQAITGNDDFKEGLRQLRSAELTDAGSEAAASLSKGIIKGFLDLDEELRELPELKNGEDKSGTTVTSAILTPDHVIFANCGDSRAVLSRAGQCVFHTQDHKPVNPEERDRITAAGGSVMIQRVNGSLAVSRALGDFEYKKVEGKGPCEQLVSPEPEIFVQRRTPEDEFLVLACDGIWDVMSNDEVCDFVRDRMRQHEDLEVICNQIVDTCLFKGSRDNMSVVLVALPAAPTVSPQAIAAETELDARLEERIKAILRDSSPADVVLPYVMHLLHSEDIQGLPPGGGLAAKRTTIEATLKRLNPDMPESDETTGSGGFDMVTLNQLARAINSGAGPGVFDQPGGDNEGATGTGP